MAIVVVIAMVIVAVIIWIVVRRFTLNVAYALRFGTIGVMLVLGGAFLRNDSESIVQAGGNLVTLMGIIFFIFGVIAFVRAILAGDFGTKE